MTETPTPTANAGAEQRESDALWDDLADGLRRLVGRKSDALMIKRQHAQMLLARCATTPAPQREGDTLVFFYRNHRGEVAERHVHPISVRWGSTEWHPEPQWLMLAFDVDKSAEREFAMRDMGAPQREDGYQAGLLPRPAPPTSSPSSPRTRR